MARPPKDRDTPLTEEEILAEAMRQFDRGAGEPSIRSLAAALRVAPSAIYHHFPSRAAIVRAAVAEVWTEAVAELLNLEPSPLEADPRETLVAVGLATRRAWLAHHALAPYLAANPEGDDVSRNSIGFTVLLLERLGLGGEAAAEAFHAYGSFMTGSVLFAAERLTANKQLDADDEHRFDAASIPGPDDEAAAATRAAIAAIIDLSRTDPARDEELFVSGLRRLLDSLVAGPREAP